MGQFLLEAAWGSFHPNGIGDTQALALLGLGGTAGDRGMRWWGWGLHQHRSHSHHLKPYGPIWPYKTQPAPLRATETRPGRTRP